MSFIPRFSKLFLCLSIVVFEMMVDSQLYVCAQNTAPRVVVPTRVRVAPQVHHQRIVPQIKYPWKTYITATIFWCGEQPTERNPTPNCKSSWDTQWAIHFGGYDDPDPANRIANHQTGEFRPKGFIPKLNPFYIALPYNDVMRGALHKPEASRVIPWFARMNPEPGKTVLKGRWVQIFLNKQSCYAQWEDCGPWVTDDWQYVFGDQPPKATQNGSAGIDLSPAIRDYLRIQSGQKIHWRFIEASAVPYGPWKKYGYDPTTERSYSESGTISSPRPTGKTIEEQRIYLEQLRKQRDANYSKKPLSGY